MQSIAREIDDLQAELTGAILSKTERKKAQTRLADLRKQQTEQTADFLQMIAHHDDETVHP